MALHHKLCHTLGGSFNLPLAEVHTVVLPQAIAFNSPPVPGAISCIERALGSADPRSAAAGLFDLAQDNGAPVALGDLGMTEADLDRAAGLALKNPYWNPREIGIAQRGETSELLQKAIEGTRPEQAEYLQSRSTGLGTPATALRKNLSIIKPGLITMEDRPSFLLGQKNLRGIQKTGPRMGNRFQGDYLFAIDEFKKRFYPKLIKKCRGALFDSFTCDSANKPKQ